MNPRISRFARICAPISLTVLAACVPQVAPPPPAPRAPVPAPAPAPAPTPAPAPAPAPVPMPENWMDAPQTSGDWTYRPGPPYSFALFGTDPGQPSFVMRCDRANRTIMLLRASNQLNPQPMQIDTETTARLLSSNPREVLGRRGLAADLSASDPLLDAMAISKGRFALQTGGEATLYVPSWPEVTRVIEDCR